jgi:hypothetical protein
MPHGRLLDDFPASAKEIVLSDFAPSIKTGDEAARRRAKAYPIDLRTFTCFDFIIGKIG